jgi:plasmid stability protein
MPRACHSEPMANLQVKNVPESLHKRLRVYARKRNCTLSDFVLEALKRELARSAFHERLKRRPQVDLGVSAAALLEKERRQREQELE